MGSNSAHPMVASVTPNPEPLAGLRILVVEDTLLVADIIADQLESWGCTVVGPAGRVQQALDLASDDALDGAVLDVKLAGEVSFPIADALRARQVPFIFLTGYDDLAIFPPEHRSAPRLAKPFSHHALFQILAAHLHKRDR